MQYLFTQWPKLKRKLQGKLVCIFLDYDGTLTQITKTPQQAVLSKEVKRTLKLLAQNPRCILIVISGRALNNLKKIIRIKNIIYVGNHGLEFGDLRTAFSVPISLKHKTILKQIKNELIEKLANIKGILIEDKNFSLCLHYRSVSKKNIPITKSIFKHVVATYQAQHKLRILTGKKVLEIAPDVLWDKGKFASLFLNLLQAILKHDQIVPLYIGDDITDEYAFSTLKNQGITIFVGKPKRTQARYHLKNIREVKTLLKSIITIANPRET